MQFIAIILIIILTALLIHWRMNRFILGSFLSTLIATLIILAGAFLISGDIENIALINVAVLALLISALIGFLFDRQRHKTKHTKPKKTKIERAKYTISALQWVLGPSGIVMILLAFFHSKTPTHVALEGLLQIVIVYSLYRRWRWALFLLATYGTLAVILLLSLVIIDLSQGFRILSPKEAAGILIGTCTAGWLIFKGALAYKVILAFEKSDQKTQPDKP